MGKRLPRMGFCNDGLRSDWSFLSWEGFAAAAESAGGVSLYFDGNIILETFDYQDQHNLVYALASPLCCDALAVWHGVISHHLSPAEATELYVSTGLPVVLVEGNLEGFPSVSYGNREGIMVVVDHLAKVHGYTRIGYAGMYRGHPGFDLRWQGFRDGLAAAGLPEIPSMIRPWWEEGAEHHNGYVEPAVFREWLQRALDAGMEALVCVTDSIAIQVLERLEEMGLSVPEDLALTGFDGFVDSQCVIPPLSTLRPDWAGMGRAAWNAARSLAEGASNVSGDRVGMDFLVRRSCGCHHSALERADRGVPACIGETGENPAGQEQASGCSAFREDIPRLLSLPEDDEAAGSFLREFRRELERGEREGAPLLDWYGILSDLLHACPAGSDARAWDRRLVRGLMLVGIHAEHARMYQRYLGNRSRFFERNFSRQLVSSWDLNLLGDLVERNREALGLGGVWISLFDDLSAWKTGAPPPPAARLVVACDAGGLQDLPPEGIAFDPRELVPGELGVFDRPGNFIIQSLHFQNSQLGFVVYRVGVHDGWIHETLSAQISAMLQGTRLVARLDANARMLASRLDELKATQAQLVEHEKMAVLGSLVTGMAHELNTPLGVSLTGATFLSNRTREIRELLASGSLRKDELASYLDDMGDSLALTVKNLHRAGDLVRSFRQVSEDHADEGFRWFSLCTVIEDTLKSMQTLIRQKAITILVDCPRKGDGPPLYGRPGIWSRILTHLVMNSALHAWPASQGGCIRINVIMEGESLVLVYSDDGCGVPEEEIPHLFEPFRTTLRNTGGSGLGIWMVWMMVTRQLGGRIEVNGGPGQGLTYRMQFPLQTEPGPVHSG